MSLGHKLGQILTLETVWNLKHACAGLLWFNEELNNIIIEINHFFPSLYGQRRFELTSSRSVVDV